MLGVLGGVGFWICLHEPVIFPFEPVSFKLRWWRVWWSEGSSSSDLFVYVLHSGWRFLFTLVSPILLVAVEASGVSRLQVRLWRHWTSVTSGGLDCSRG